MSETRHYAAGPAGRARARLPLPALRRGRVIQRSADRARRLCSVCGLDLSAQDAGDGPAVFVILFLGFIVVGLAAIVEIRFSTAALGPHGAVDAADPRRRDPDAAAAEGRADRAAIPPRPAAIAAGRMSRTRFRPRLLPTLFRSPARLLCCRARDWQLQRLEWKRGLIAAARSGAGRAAGRPAAHPRRGPHARISPCLRRGRLSQRQGDSFSTRSDRRADAGFHVLTPLREPDGRTVFVNRGFVPTDSATAPGAQPASRPERPDRRAVARARRTASRLVPAGQPSRPQLLVLDRPAGDGVAAEHLTACRAVLYRCRRHPQPRRLAARRRHAAALPNDHLQYAITWFSPRCRGAGDLCPVAAPPRRTQPRMTRPESRRIRNSKPLSPPRRRRGGDCDAALGRRRDDAAGRRGVTRRTARDVAGHCPSRC